jgi:hypothetical protein
MQQINLHKQKLLALAEAGIALIALFLTWMTAGVEGFPQADQSKNGLGGWGLLTAVGIAGVAFASLSGDKTKNFDSNSKKIALASFLAIALGAIIYYFRLRSLSGAQQYQNYTLTVKTVAGPGLWMALVAGIIGLAWVSGLLEKLSTPAAPATPVQTITINPATPGSSNPPNPPTA